MKLIEMVLRKKFKQEGHTDKWIDAEIREYFRKVELYNGECLHQIYVTEDYELIDHELDDHWVNDFGNVDIGSIPVVKIGDFYVAITSTYQGDLKKELLTEALQWEFLPEEYYMKEVEAV